MRSRAATVAAILVVIAALASCYPTPQPAAELTAGSALTEVVATAKPVDTPASSPAVAELQPPSAEVCNGMAQAMMRALNVEVTQSQEPVPFTDPATGASGTACRASVTGSGEQFSGPDAVMKSINAVLTGGGWVEDPNLAAGGPTGIGEGFRSGSIVCEAAAGWTPDASANCPTDQPISACKVTPAQQIYTITVDCATTAPAGPPAANTSPSGIANPASQNCLAQGGRLEIEIRGDGGQFGVCYFEDNHQCEEWAMMRGDCPIGGVKVTGYTTPAARYCAISGGEYTATGNSGQTDEQGACTLKGGATCDAATYYNGACAAASGTF